MNEPLVIPDDLQTCQRLLRELAEAHARLQRVHQELLTTCMGMQKSQEKLQQEQEELQLTIHRLMHQLYGRRSERWKEADGQQHLDFDDGCGAEPEGSEGPAPEDEQVVQQHRRKKRNKRRRSEQLPAHLERRTERIEPLLPEGVRREDCRLLGIDIVEMLEYKRPELWVRRLEYPKYKLLEPLAPKILQAPREVSLIEGGRFGFSIAAEVLYGKFAVHVPLYRQQDTLAQLGWSPNRSTLCRIVANSAELLRPLVERLTQRVLASGVIGTDDTPVTLLTPGEGKGSRQARFWLYRGREAAPYNVFAFTDNREREGPDRFLETFTGTLSGDCYSGYVNIEKVSGGRIVFSACLGHARRKIFDARQQQPGLSSKMLALIGELYDIEDRGRVLSDEQRLDLRQRESVPLLARLREVLDSEAAKRVLPRSSFGEALGYLRNHWPAFQVYLSDGRVPIDNNDVERDLRRVAVGRKNWLFVGSQCGGERAATILSVVASAHRHDLDVCAYLRDVLEQLARGAEDLDALLPDAWKISHPEHVRTFREHEKQERAETRRFQRASRRLARRNGQASA